MQYFNTVLYLNLQRSQKMYGNMIQNAILKTWIKHNGKKYFKNKNKSEENLLHKHKKIIHTFRTFFTIPTH